MLMLISLELAAEMINRDFCNSNSTAKFGKTCGAFVVLLG